MVRSLDEDAQLRRQRCTPRVIQEQSVVLDGALRQQPSEAPLADMAARQRFGRIGDADARQRKLDGVRPGRQRTQPTQRSGHQGDEAKLVPTRIGATLQRNRRSAIWQKTS
jgi:hypothetical protein